MARRTGTVPARLRRATQLRAAAGLWRATRPAPVDARRRQARNHPVATLTLSEIFNGAVGYIRANPRATLGLTATVVVLMQILSLIATVGPLTAFGRLTTDRPDEPSGGVVVTWMASMAAGLLVTWLGGMLLSGMLTVIVRRAVFGSPITIGETWAKIRGRLLPCSGWRCWKPPWWRLCSGWWP